MLSVVVVVVMVLVTFVIVSNPGEIIVSTREKGWPSFTISKRGVVSNEGEVQLKFTPLIVCVEVAVGVGLM
tara:strand:- start:6890 stop:7102 length:213 start_codon:yes stop_codon:yes gene_type:complete